MPDEARLSAVRECHGTLRENIEVTKQLTAEAEDLINRGRRVSRFGGSSAHAGRQDGAASSL
jgi:hypothetical protein